MLCVNIDWLEVFCEEPFTHDASFFQSKGLKVKSRAYGTPQYSEMFEILDEQNRSVLEIRRAPYSIKQNGGIFNSTDCHIRLSNRTCYAKDPIGYLRTFLYNHGYKYKNISRIDLCCDFTHFCDGTDPKQFVKSYMEGIFLKINQSKLSSFGYDLTVHGTDTFTSNKEWNSISWGSKKSSISTKMYNKSLEMKQKKTKHYIISHWEMACLNYSENDVWRVEFSLSSQIKGYVRLDDGELILSTLSNYDEKDKLIKTWKLLAKRYFHFKQAGTSTRKDRMQDVITFDFSDTEIMKPVRISDTEDFTRTERILINYVRELFSKVQLTKTEHDSLIGTLQILERIRKNKIRGYEDLFMLTNEDNGK